MSQGMIYITQKGDFKRTEKWFMKLAGDKGIKRVLEKYGKKGVEALALATPKDTGLTAASWDYRIIQNKGEIDIVWTNSNINRGVNIALILQYGHGTRNGGYVQGIDYINPALRSIFTDMADEAWEVMVKYE